MTPKQVEELIRMRFGEDTIINETTLDEFRKNHKHRCCYKLEQKKNGDIIHMTNMWYHIRKFATKQKSMVIIEPVDDRLISCPGVKKSINRHVSESTLDKVLKNDVLAIIQEVAVEVKRNGRFIRDIKRHHAYIIS